MNTLTFGIELEFLAIRPPTLEVEVREALYDAMLDVGIPATGYEKDIADDDDSKPYSRWRVDTDHLDLSQEEEMYLPPGWTQEAVEISSRKFDFYGENWRGEVAKVLQVLRHLEGRGCRFLTNKTTGFHVHVGNGEQKIPLRTAKNVFQLLTAHEKTIDGLHAVSRIVAPVPARYYHYYYPLSFFHGYAANPEGENRNVFDWLANIEQGVTSYADLGDFFTCLREEAGVEWDMNGHHSSVNFDNLFTDEENGKFEDQLTYTIDDNLFTNEDVGQSEEQLTGTIEFRQHAGTLDYLEICAWVMLVVGVVEFCGKSSDEEILHLCLRAGEKGFGLEDLLAALDMNADVMDHYLNQHQGAAIGTLPSCTQSLGPIPPEGLFNSILEQNDHESSENTDDDEVKAAIAWKYLTGLYGLNPGSKIDITDEAVVSGLRQAMATVSMHGIDPYSGEGRSRCRVLVLREVAGVYQRGRVKGRLPLTSTVWS